MNKHVMSKLGCIPKKKLKVKGTETTYILIPNIEEFSSSIH